MHRKRQARVVLPLNFKKKKYPNPNAISLSYSDLFISIMQFTCFQMDWVELCSLFRIFIFVYVFIYVIFLSLSAFLREDTFFGLTKICVVRLI